MIKENLANNFKTKNNDISTKLIIKEKDYIKKIVKLKNISYKACFKEIVHSL